MADVRAAILNAVLEADRLHKEFDTKARADRGEGRINVFEMLVKRQIPVMFQPLKGLLGAFLKESWATSPTRAWPSCRTIGLQTPTRS